VALSRYHVFLYLRWKLIGGGLDEGQEKRGKVHKVQDTLTHRSGKHHRQEVTWRYWTTYLRHRSRCYRGCFPVSDKASTDSFSSVFRGFREEQL